MLAITPQGVKARRGTHLYLVTEVAGAGRVCSDVSVERAPGKRIAVEAQIPASPASATQQRLDDLIRSHSPYVAQLAHRFLGREDEVDDVVQDVFLSLFRHLDQIRQTESLRSWLATTTVRMVGRRMRLRRIGFLLRFKDRVDPTELVGQGASPEDCAALSKVHRALEKVAVKTRIAWVLRYLEQERIEDVARICRCSMSTAKRRIALAHEVVKRALSDDE